MDRQNNFKLKLALLSGMGSLRGLVTPKTILDNHPELFYQLLEDMQKLAVKANKAKSKPKQLSF